MAEIDVTQRLRTIDGKGTMKNEKRADGTGGEDITLRSVCVNALLVGRQEGSDGQKKLLKFLLAERIETNKFVHLTGEELVLLKECIAEVYFPLVVGRAFEILDPACITKHEKVTPIQKKKAHGNPTT